MSFEHCIEILPIFAIGGMRNVLKCAFVLGTNYGDKHSDEAYIEISIFFSIELRFRRNRSLPNT